MKEILESINLMKKSIETLSIETDELKYNTSIKS